ncbi:maltokinase N-terminal cap-like domain-containing protein [Nocardioides sp.]|uniref:maltokinase N-terminal cap-like domain-containing protein n=1 Tax=Nocardioides sp. TaxID=35761 RepID=UPI003D0B1BB1
MTPDKRLPDPQFFATYLERTRWFGGKGRGFTVTDVLRLGQVPGSSEDGTRAVIYLVELTYTDVAADAADRTDLYQVPLSFYTDPESRLDHAFVGWWEDPDHGWVHAYDALHDREAMACWLRSFAQAAEEESGPADSPSPLVFHRLPGHELDLEAHSALFSGEQSNSSVAFGEDALMKVFRRVTPGINPDIQIHEVLTRAGSEHVAGLYGWLDTVDAASGSVMQLAMLQQFLRTASDGFELAKTSVRNLYAEGDLHADEVGGDFAAEAARLGMAVAEVHEALRRAFEVGTVDAGFVAGQMRERLVAAQAVVPELAQHAAALRTLFEQVSTLGDVTVQRIHGDLHLGQTLRTSRGWKIVDFEGEPAKPLAERMLPDSAWRDVAGMLRSFDYAPHVVERTAADTDSEGGAQRAYRANEWATRNREAFVDAYIGREPTPAEMLLLRAYEADKAVYEAVYEARNRPSWIPIPLAAIARLAGTP